MTVLDSIPALLDLPLAGEEAGSSPNSPPMGEPSRRWKWTGDDLIHLGEAGFLPPEGRFELLDGEIFELTPPNPLHASDVDVVGFLLDAEFGPRGAHARIEKPIRLRSVNQPQPDVAVVRGPRGTYRNQFPGPEDVFLVVEVSDSSLEHDRERKLPAYAAAGIPECWLVNLRERQLEVYRDPAESGYRSFCALRSGDMIEPLLAPGVSLAVADLLGEQKSEGQ